MDETEENKDNQKGKVKMDVIDQVIEKDYAIYNADCVDVLQSLPDKSIHLSIYSPPFATKTGGALYHYSSSERDLSNADTYEQFFEHYRFVVKEINRLTHPGRISAVHCADVASGNSGCDYLVDFPGDIIRLHESEGFKYIGRYCVWKEPLGVRNRTMTKSLMHETIVNDSSRCSNASADYLVVFRKDGKNTIPIAHPVGFLDYAGSRLPPNDVLAHKGFTGKQTANIYSHWIWRQYASSFWDDIRLERVMPYEEARDQQDEKHCHPLQLDVIERCIQLWSNEGEVVCSPFMGVGSEVYQAAVMNRKAIGAELKPSYFRQAVKNMRLAYTEKRQQEILPGIDTNQLPVLVQTKEVSDAAE